MKQTRGFFEKPDNREIDSVTNRAAGVKQAVQYVLERKNCYENEVAEAYNALTKERIDRTLKELDIEILNRDKAGFRLAALRNAGINDIYSLLQNTFAELSEINGISEEAVLKILDKARAIRREVVQSVGLKLDYDSRTKESSTIVNRIGLLHHCRGIFDEALSIYQNYDEMLTEGLNKTVYMKSVLRWIFASRDVKEECLQAYDNLVHFLDLDVAERAKELAFMVEELDRSYTTDISWNKFQENTAPFYTVLEKLIPDAAGAAEEYGDNAPDELVAEVERFVLDTSLMKSPLRSYQEFGCKFILNQKRVLLGDEMGLGKTVQAVGAMAHLKAEGKRKFMVVCPVSVLINWKREILLHSELTVTDIYGSDREQEYREWQQKGGVGITTYETISRLDFGMPELDMLVVDEAHYIKNPEANRTKAFISLMTNADDILLMTGTPLENKVDEMKTLIGYLQPEIAAKVSAIKNIANAEQFREDVAPVYLRRTRDAVLKELPDKLEKQEWCAMGEAEKDAYVEALKSGNYMKVRQVSWNVEDLKDSGKAKRLLEICEAARLENRKIVIFSYFIDTLRKVSSFLGERCKGVIDGSVPAAERQHLIDEFVNAEAGSTLVCQIVAGGVGLNIQSASVVILCEPQWKPSTENQAISRVYRMGQAQSVSVHRLLTVESVDEEILQVLQKKTEIFNEFADESVVGEMNVKESEKEFMVSVMKKELEKYGISEEQKPQQE